MGPEKSFKLGFDVGGEVANSLYVQDVVVVAMGLVDSLPEDERPRMTPKDVPDYVDAEQFSLGYTQGMRARCGEIVERLNSDRRARLGATT